MQITCNVPVPYVVVEELAKTCPDDVSLESHITDALCFACDHPSEWVRDRATA